jgi:hypothetical protein
MRVKILKPIKGYANGEGDIINIPDPLFDKLIKVGKVEEVEEVKKKDIEDGKEENKRPVNTRPIKRGKKSSKNHR